MNSTNLHEIYLQRKRCVAIAEYKQNIYYAISGEDGKKTNRIADEIEAMIGANRTVRCFIDDTFTVLCYIDYPNSYYKSLEKYIYQCLHNSGKAMFVFPEYIGMKMWFNSSMLRHRSYHPIRNYSCVERKIIGSIGKKTIEVIVGLNPCYLCLPAVQNVTYFDYMDNKVHTLQISKRMELFNIKQIK